MRESPEVRRIVNRWWPATDTTPRKTEDTLRDFATAMVKCQAELILHHLHLGEIAQERVSYALATLVDLEKRGAIVQWPRS